jgi:hypothetical protein
LYNSGNPFSRAETCLNYDPAKGKPMWIKPPLFVIGVCILGTLLLLYNSFSAWTTPNRFRNSARQLRKKLPGWYPLRDFSEGKNWHVYAKGGNPIGFVLMLCFTIVLIYAYIVGK